MKTRLALILFAAVLLINPGLSQGAIFDFSNLPGPNATPYTGSTQGDFTVTPTSGIWQQGFNVGNPIPSIFNFTSDATSASLAVTENSTGFFTFDSIDFGTGGNGSYDYSIIGFLNAIPEFSLSGTFSGSAFMTVLNSFNSDIIDTLQITLQNPLITSFNVDNIVVSTANAPVPEPATLILLGAGLIGLAGYSRRKLN